MKFEVWEALDISKDIKEQEKRLISRLTPIENSRTDDEGIFKADVFVNNLENLLDLAALLEDDIVIFSPDFDILMSKRTMRELGLG